MNVKHIINVYVNKPKTMSNTIHSFTEIGEACRYIHNEIVNLRANEPNKAHIFLIEEGICDPIKALNDCIYSYNSYGENTTYNTYKCYPNNGNKNYSSDRHLIQTGQQYSKSYDAMLFKEHGDVIHPLKWLAE